MTETGDKDHRLDWTPNRRITPKAANRRVGLGRGLRVVFWALPLIVAGAVVYFLVSPGSSPTEPVISPSEGEAGVVRMVNPKLRGRDNEGEPFQVLAETLIRRPDQANNITELEFPSLLDGADEDGVGRLRARIDAERGVYDSDAEILDLYADVDLSTETGYAFRTSHARIFIAERRAEGEEPVEGEGPFGTVSADRWSYTDDGAVLHFEGNVRTVIETGPGDNEEDAGQ